MVQFIAPKVFIKICCAEFVLAFIQLKISTPNGKYGVSIQFANGTN